MTSRKRKRKQVAVMQLWSKRGNQRFCDAVESFQSLVNDLEMIIAPKRRKLAARLIGEVAAGKAAADRAAANGKGAAS